MHLAETARFFRIRPLLSALSILVAFVAVGCQSDTGMPDSSYQDGEYGYMRLRSANSGDINGVKGLVIDCDVYRHGNHENATGPNEWVGYFARLKVADPRKLLFTRNGTGMDSMSQHLLLEEPSLDLSETQKTFFIPFNNIELPTGRYSMELVIEARKFYRDSTSYQPFDHPNDILYTASVPLSVVMPRRFLHRVSVNHFAVNEALVDPYSFDWPSARPDLFYAVSQRCGRSLLGDFSATSNIQWRSTAWDDPGESLQFYLCEGDSIDFEVYDYDRLDANDFLGSFPVDVRSVANKGPISLPDFGQVKDLRLEWRMEDR